MPAFRNLNSDLQVLVPSGCTTRLSAWTAKVPPPWVDTVATRTPKLAGGWFGDMRAD